MEQPACLCPAGLGVDDAGRAAPSGGGEVQAGQFLFPGPADEVPGFAAPGGLVAGDPGVQIVLPARGQGEVAGGEPVQEGDRGPDVLADAGQLVVGGIGALGAAAEPSQQMPDGIPVQHVLLIRVVTAGGRGGDPALQPGHLLIAVGQRADGDQDGPQVLDRLAARPRVEGGVSELGLGVQAPQDRGGGALVQPGRDGAGPFGGGEGLTEGTKARLDLAGLVAEQVTQPPVDSAPGAPPGVDPAGLAAGRAAGPEPRVGTGAGGAERFGPGAAADPAGLAAARAACPALLAGPAPGFTGRLGDHAWCLTPANTAGRDIPGSAAGAQRSVFGADADRAAAMTARAGFLVDRVGYQAVRAQRLPVLVAGGRLPHGPAARAWLSPGPGHAVPAQPHPVTGLDQWDHPAAVRAGRLDDALGPGLNELADQPEHGRDRRRSSIPA